MTCKKREFFLFYWLTCQWLAETKINHIAIGYLLTSITGFEIIIRERWLEEKNNLKVKKKLRMFPWLWWLPQIKMFELRSCIQTNRDYY